MKKKTLKRLAGAAGITSALLLPLTVLPGLNFKIEGPLGITIEKFSGEFLSMCLLQTPLGTLMNGWNSEVEGKAFGGPEGISRNPGGFYFRFRNFWVRVVLR